MRPPPSLSLRLDVELGHDALTHHQVDLADLRRQLLVRLELLQTQEDRVLGEQLGRVGHGASRRRFLPTHDDVGLSFLLGLDHPVEKRPHLARKDHVLDSELDDVETNLLGTLELIRQARDARVGRFIFISSCAVHEVILDDRPLDETHPLWSLSHYGAHKAAIEKFVHSLGLGDGYPICALRPTGIYGVARPVQNSKWYDLVRQVAAGEPVESARGGKEVHAADVAKAVALLLIAQGIEGQAYNSYDMYIAEQHVAQIAKQITGSKSPIAEINKGPKNQIRTEKLRNLGMQFGGQPLLEKTVHELLAGSA